jgi:hypothetical protein
MMNELNNEMVQDEQWSVGWNRFIVFIKVESIDDNLILNIYNIETNTK